MKKKTSSGGFCTGQFLMLRLKNILGSKVISPAKTPKNRNFKVRSRAKGSFCGVRGQGVLIPINGKKARIQFSTSLESIAYLRGIISLRQIAFMQKKQENICKALKRMQIIWDNAIV